MVKVVIMFNLFYYRRCRGINPSMILTVLIVSKMGRERTVGVRTVEVRTVGVRIGSWVGWKIWVGNGWMWMQCSLLSWAHQPTMQTSCPWQAWPQTHPSHSIFPIKYNDILSWYWFHNTAKYHTCWFPYPYYPEAQKNTHSTNSKISSYSGRYFVWRDRKYCSWGWKHSCRNCGNLEIIFIMGFLCPNHRRLGRFLWATCITIIWCPSSCIFAWIIGIGLLTWVVSFGFLGCRWCFFWIVCACTWIWGRARWTVGLGCPSSSSTAECTKNPRESACLNWNLLASSNSISNTAPYLSQGLPIISHSLACRSSVY